MAEILNSFGFQIRVHCNVGKVKIMRFFFTNERAFLKYTKLKGRNTLSHKTLISKYSFL